MTRPRYAYMEPDEQSLADLTRASIVDGRALARLHVREEGRWQLLSGLMAVFCWVSIFWYGSHGDMSMVCSFGFQGLCMFGFELSRNSQRYARRSEREFERDLLRFDLGR